MHEPIRVNFIHTEKEGVRGHYVLYTSNGKIGWSKVNDEIDGRFPTISGDFDTAPLIPNEKAGQIFIEKASILD